MLMYSSYLEFDKLWSFIFCKRYTFYFHNTFNTLTFFPYKDTKHSCQQFQPFSVKFLSYLKVQEKYFILCEAFPNFHKYK